MTSRKAKQLQSCGYQPARCKNEQARAAETPRVGGGRGIDQIVDLEISEDVYVNHVYASASAAGWNRDGGQHYKLGAESQELIRVAMTELNLTARAYDRILKVCRTLAYLAQSESITSEHVSEAIRYRTFDRTFWV